MAEKSNTSNRGLKVPRCVNLDWLEVFAQEPAESVHDADYFMQCQYIVHVREFGTRIYTQMFTIEDNKGEPWIEVRRAPASNSVIGGLFSPLSCHLRVVNRQLYVADAIQRFQEFCAIHQYTISRISRIDICLDFIRFDSGDLPGKFVERYIRGRYAKINQANIRAYGVDNFEKRHWNSLSWGSPKSMVSTKLYNKTLELEQVKDKPYIKQSWFAYGLTDNPQMSTRKGEDGLSTRVDIWRLEFSVKSSVKGWFVIERDGNQGQYHSIKHTLEMYNSPSRLLAVFSSLCQHYFHFKYYEKGVVKSKLLDKPLFDFSQVPIFYKIELVSKATPRNQALVSLQNKLKQYRLTHTSPESRAAVDVLLKAIRDEDLSRYCENPFSREELLALQLAISRRRTHPQESVSDILTFIKEIVGDSQDYF